MTLATNRAPALHVRRLAAHYLTHVDHPAPGPVKARLDDALRRGLVAALGDLARPLASQAEGVWLIRRLDFEASLNTIWDDETIARRVAAGVTLALLTTLEGGADGDNVRHYPSEADYLGEFLTDLAAGVAWDRWYYRRFDGLRMLPTSAALRTAIGADPALGLAALLGLSTLALASVVRALTPIEAARVADLLCAAGLGADEGSALAAAWEALAAGDSGESDSGRATLRLVLAVARTHPTVLGPALPAAIQALLTLADSLAQAPATRHALVAALASADLAGLYRLAGASAAERLLPLLRADATWLAGVAATLAERAAPSPAPSGDVPRATPYGAIFLLLPLLDDTVSRALEGDAIAADDADRLRLTLLLKCLGRERAARAFLDPLIRDLLRVPPDLTMRDLADWQTRRAGRLLRPTPALPAEMILTRLVGPGAPGVLLADGRDGAWLAALGYQPARPASLARRLAPWLAGASEALLIADGDLSAPLRAAFPALRVVSPDSEAARQRAEADPRLTENLTRRPTWSGDLAYLTLAPPLRGPRPVDLALSAWAQRSLRDFAWRLPGFGLSSLPYLYTNFLDLAATLEDEPRRRVVRLGRPPLNLVLTMTGMTRTTYRAGWLDDRPFALFQEG